MNTCTHGRTHACTHTHTHTHIQIPFLTVLMMKLHTYHYLVSSLSIIMYSAKVQLFQFQVKMWRKINSPVFDRPTLSLSLEMWQWRHCVWHRGGFEHPGMTVNLQHLCQFRYHKSFPQVLNIFTPYSPWHNLQQFKYSKKIDTLYFLNRLMRKLLLLCLPSIYGKSG